MANLSNCAPGINIWSGAVGLGGALTNMSVRAREKGCIKHEYPVVVAGLRYPDSEAAYQALKQPGRDAFNDELMTNIICLKFRQNPKLLTLVDESGGMAWLVSCQHLTGAKSPRFQAWEGVGMASRFIRNLVAGYLKEKAGASVDAFAWTPEPTQSALF